MILNEARRDAYMPLAEAGVPKGAEEKLAALGITTLQELRDYWAFGNEQVLLDYLGESLLRLASYRPAAGATRGVEPAAGGNLVNFLAAGTQPPII